MLNREPEVAAVNRRVHGERRKHNDRRNLVRFEDVGNERRMGLARRKAEIHGAASAQAGK